MLFSSCNADIVLEDLNENDLNSLIKNIATVREFREQFDILNKKLQKRIITILKEKSWDSYMDDTTKISVNIVVNQRDKVNKSALKIILNEDQLKQIISKESEEGLQVITKKDRERLKNMYKK